MPTSFILKTLDRKGFAGGVLLFDLIFVNRNTEYENRMGLRNVPETVSCNCGGSEFYSQAPCECFFVSATGNEISMVQPGSGSLFRALMVPE